VNEIDFVYPLSSELREMKKENLVRKNLDLLIARICIDGSTSK